MILDVLRIEWRSMIRERATWAVLLLFAALVAYGTVSGAGSVIEERGAQAAVLAEEQARFAALREELAAIEAGGAVRHASDPRSALLVGRDLGKRAATLPPGPLAAVAIGQRDVLPNVVLVTSEARVADAGGDDAQSPTRLMSGAFDLAFVLVFLLPLVVIALTYDLLAGERERGTLGLVLSQPVSLPTFVLGKALSRALLVGLVLLLGVLGPVLAAGVTGAGAAPRLALYVGLLLAYAAFWFTAAIAVNAYGRTAAGNALGLIGLWLALVVVVPGLASVAVDTIHPPPSRVELVNLARAAAADAEERVTALEGDHGQDEARRAARAAPRALEVQEDLERTVGPVLAAFRDQLARQQSLVERVRFVSPAIVMHEGLTDVAGSGVRRHQHFASQVEAFHDDHQGFFRERIRAEAALDRAAYDAMPTFALSEEPLATLGGRVLAGLAGLLLPTAALLVLAIARLRRPIVVEAR